MLIIYFFMILFAIILFQLINFVVHIFYLVKISLLTDSIKCKDDLLFLRLRDYEYAIAEAFKRKGYKIQMSEHFGEGGNGIIINDIYYVLARKESYQNLIEIEQAKKLAKHMKDNDIHRGMIITLGDFKQNTKNYCHTHVIKCINGDQLLQMFKDVQTVSSESLFVKYFQ